MFLLAIETFVSTLDGPFTYRNKKKTCRGSKNLYKELERAVQNAYAFFRACLIQLECLSEPEDCPGVCECDRKLVHQIKDLLGNAVCLPMVCFLF